MLTFKTVQDMDDGLRCLASQNHLYLQWCGLGQAAVSPGLSLFSGKMDMIIILSPRAIVRITGDDLCAMLSVVPGILKVLSNIIIVLGTVAHAFNPSTLTG